MREIQGLEGKTSGDSGMLPIAPSNQHSEDNILPTTVSEAVETLFEFIERDVQMVDLQQQATYLHLQSHIRQLLGTERQSLVGVGTGRKGKQMKSTSKRTVVQPSVTAVDSDEDEESDGGVSSFEATPAFKKQQSKVPMMITRSQKKTNGRGRKRTAKQANLPSEAQIIEAAAIDCTTTTVETATDSSNTANQRALRSTKKRRVI